MTGQGEVKEGDTQPLREDLLERCENAMLDVREGSIHKSMEDLASCQAEIDAEYDNVLDHSFTAEVDLKELEKRLLAEWRPVKARFERWHCVKSALRGVQIALQAVMQHHEWRLHCVSTADSESMAKEAKGAKEATDSQAPSNPKEEDEAIEAIEAHDLSSVLGDPAMTKEQEEIVKKMHPGSASHPNGCRPCHFQGIQCFKGLQCSFCHICQKPKRKSKHQRDVDKKRQERQRQVKDDLGAECLEQMQKIDEGKRLIMQSSEEAKRRIKNAFETKLNLEAARAMVEKMETAVNSYVLQSPPFPEFDSQQLQGEGKKILEGWVHDEGASSLQDFRRPGYSGGGEPEPEGHLSESYTAYAWPTAIAHGALDNPAQQRLRPPGDFYDTSDETGVLVAPVVSFIPVTSPEASAAEEAVARDLTGASRRQEASLQQRRKHSCPNSYLGFAGPSKSRAARLAQKLGHHMCVYRMCVWQCMAVYGSDARLLGRHRQQASLHLFKAGLVDFKRPV
eukprot:CAMPEP_0170641358 /NCGR_PEP_ID=MMETSP0224-20130122/40719_1 /TAXON_ID=285029 /ORGANISM="Togula jolla, Strain CCCM 725" /LENGTH=507 /DNA_ID=CAMNT_0010971933 /DNA_START=212 /DNA_END=1733 /DNA_ORIENTATION=-